jgi:hypothetical protein
VLGLAIAAPARIHPRRCSTVNATVLGPMTSTGQTNELDIIGAHYQTLRPQPEETAWRPSRSRQPRARVGVVGPKRATPLRPP